MCGATIFIFVFLFQFLTMMYFEYWCNYFCFNFSVTFETYTIIYETKMWATNNNIHNNKNIRLPFWAKICPMHFLNLISHANRKWNNLRLKCEQKKHRHISMDPVPEQNCIVFPLLLLSYIFTTISVLYLYDCF